ncbi:MAG: two-component system response regulator [Deltaproteobacteria bacterium]|nr:MAG: two-component system response regulator [Deltaproteobacteria bacterium]
MKIKILLVDDERDFIDALAKRLTLRDFDVTAVYSGEEALDVFGKRIFDIVLLDVKLPGMSGIDVLKQMKAAHPLVQVLMLTGHATVENAIKGMKCGAYDYLMKPVEIKALEAKLSVAYAVRAEQIERIRKAEVESLITRRGW